MDKELRALEIHMGSFKEKASLLFCLLYDVSFSQHHRGGVKMKLKLFQMYIETGFCVSYQGYDDMDWRVLADVWEITCDRFMEELK